MTRPMSCSALRRRHGEELVVGLGAQLEDAERGRVVDEDGGRRELAGGAGELRPVVVVEAARARALRVDAGLTCEQTLRELLGGHLEREVRHAAWLLRMQRRVSRQRKAKCSFSHGWPSCHDHHVRRLPAARHVVQGGKTRRDARDAALAAVDGLEVLDGRHHHLINTHDALAELGLGDLEDLALGLVQEVEGVRRRVEGLPDDARHGRDKLAEQALLGDDARVVLDVGRGRDARRELGEVVAADGVVLAAALEFFRERDKVHGVAALEERLDGLVDFLVPPVVERVRGEDLDGLRDRVALDEDRPEHGLLDVDGLRRHPAGALAQRHDVGRPAPARHAGERDLGPGFVDAERPLLEVVVHRGGGQWEMASGQWQKRGVRRGGAFCHWPLPRRR